MSVSEILTEGVGEYAVIRSKIGLIIAVVIAVILTVISISIFRAKKVFTEEVKSTITEVKCVEHHDQKNKNLTFSCNIDVSYKVGEQTFTKNITKKSNNKFQVGEIVSVYTEKGNPSNASGDKDTNKWAYILLFVSLILVGLSYTLLHFTTRYKGFAKISGGVQAIGDIAGAFRGGR
jgi:hypothetical protein